MAIICCNFNGAMYRCGNPSILDGKMDEGTIFVFSHNTCTIYGKKKNKIEGAKNKNFKPHGSKIYLTLNLNDRQGI
jgi:hypothetical protein